MQNNRAPDTCLRHTPLPASWAECRQLGWDAVDILLVSGDAYIDHPSFGVSLIARLLAAAGYRVALLAQPRFTCGDDFRQYPPPRLFCGITAGNLDSIVANYSGNGKVRDRDAYSPAGNPWRGEEKSRSNRRRPDRATLVYTSLARAAFPGTPMVLGGLESSLRRFVHYDFQQERLRSSFLTEAKADLLVYGMGEKAVLEIARRRAGGIPLTGIPGTCERRTDREMAGIVDTKQVTGSPDVSGSTISTTTSEVPLLLPSWAEIATTPALFLAAEIAIDQHSRAHSRQQVAQRQQSLWVVQNPPPPPLTVEELDDLYALPFSRRPHPAAADIPAFTMIRDSVTIVRGCSGNCSFCAITRHQGATVVSRSTDSIVAECARIAKGEDFSGTISDLGGPTANLFASHCTVGGCRRRDCLYPEPCAKLHLDEERFLSLLDRVGTISGIKRVFISSGLRMALLLKTPRLLARILQRHTPGAMKIAPEHSDDELLRIMHKESHALLVEFVDTVRRIGRTSGLGRVELSPYLITAHPGSTPACAQRLVRDMRRLGLQVRAFQDFTATPGTLATAMYYTGLRADTGQPLPVPRGHAARRRERDILAELLPGPASPVAPTKKLKNRRGKS